MLQTRSFALDDITATGRTVEAYAAVFDVETDISDSQGRYRERIARTAFDQSLANGRLPVVIYNHARTLQGTPSESGSVPIGKCVECRADQRGLLTVTEYANTARADELLELIKAGAITAQSFAGRFVESTPQRRSYQPSDVVTRTRIDIHEYGPTPFPAYPSAEVVGVRSEGELLSESLDLRWRRHKLKHHWR